MTKSIEEQRKQRFAQTNKPPGGLLSRGSAALTEEEATKLLDKLLHQPPSTRSWSQIRMLRESTLLSKLRPRILKMAIETCIEQGRVELESSTRSLLELPLSEDDKARYEKIHVLSLINAGNINEAFEIQQLTRFVAAVVEHDFYLCGSLAKNENDPFLRKLMQKSIEKEAKIAIDFINSGLRVPSRPDAIAHVQEFATSLQAVE